MSTAEEKTGVRIRKARRTDAARIAELSTQLGYPSTAHQIETRLLRLMPRSKHAVFVAEAPGPDVVGWIHVSVANLLECDVRAEANGLAVAEAHHTLPPRTQLLATAPDSARHLP